MYQFLYVKGDDAFFVSYVDVATNVRGNNESYWMVPGTYHDED